jgi:arylsulfatase
LYWELAGYGGQQALRLGDWKAVRRELKKGNQRVELYDLAQDPQEARDLAGERLDLAAELARQLDAQHVEHPRFKLTK